LETVIASLRRYVTARFPDLDADDVVQATITGLLERGHRIDDVESARAYLLGATRYRAIDTLRARNRRPQVPLEAIGEQPTGDDDVARLIDLSATRASVYESLQASVIAGDELLVRVVTVWLDVAEEQGHAPSTREIAPLVGVSHTSVAKALERFRRVLAQGS
jgi:DNA-directed RNA polymerase specialized sigma24 family protein